MSSTASTSLTQQQLLEVNDLTRASLEPGNLDYITYCWYLVSINHVKNASASSNSQDNRRALNTYLQQRTTDRNDKKTDFRADQALWSLNNLPDLIYSFERPKRWLDKYSLKDPPLKLYAIYGRHLRDIPILPDHISIDLEGWRLEAWTRFDPRVGLEDILQRINPIYRPNNKSLIQMRTKRFREQCHLLGWTAPGSAYTARKKMIIELMQLAGVDTTANTTRGLTWGLIDPADGSEGLKVEIPATQLSPSTVEEATPEMLQPLPITIRLPSNTSRSLPDIPEARPIVIPATPQKRKRNGRSEADKIEETTEDTTESTQPTFSLYTPPPRPQRPRAESPPQTPTPMPRYPHDTRPIVVMYFGKPLVLKSPAQRMEEQHIIDVLTSQFYPVGSSGRRRQLEYILDPNRLAAGFVDNRGLWPPVGYQGCLDADILYGI